MIYVSFIQIVIGTTDLLPPSRLDRSKRKALHLPQSLTILIKNNRQRNHHNANKPQQRIPPPQPQRLIQGRSGEREKCTHQTAANGVGRDGRRSVHGVAVDQVGQDGQEEAHDAEAKGRERDDGQDPVCLVVGAPAVPEEGDWEEGAGEDADSEAHLGLKEAAVGFG